MSSKNIFEVLQNIAENTESNEKFLNILKENGFTGTLEEAENQINQQTQVVLNNLTTEDLQNIAGGKSLMNDKLKKALAVGGASLMAAGTVVPSGSALNMAKVKDKFKEYTDKGLTYVGKHPIHTGTTAALAAIAGTLIIKNILHGRPSAPLSSNEDMLTYLIEKDLSAGKQVLNFISLCATGNCTITVGTKGTETTLKFTGSEDVPLKDKLWNDDNSLEFTIDSLLEAFVSLMTDDGNETYVTGQNTLTAAGANVLNTMSEPLRNLLNCVIKNAKPSVEDEENEIQDADETQNKVNEANNKLEAYKANKTKLETFIDALIAHVNGLLDKVNNMESEDRTDRNNEVKKFTEQNSTAFEDAWNAFTNAEDLKNAEILTDTIRDEIKQKFVTELTELATSGTQSQDITSLKEQLKADTGNKFKPFMDQESELQDKVDQAKAAQKPAKAPQSKKKDAHIATVTIPSARHFEDGEILTLKQTAQTVDDN